MFNIHKKTQTVQTIFIFVRDTTKPGFRQIYNTFVVKVTRWNAALFG